MSTTNPRFINMYDFFSGELFPGERYTIVIPNYQRGYKWAVKELGQKDDSSVEYLIRTIMDGVKGKTELFLQGITVSDKEKDNNGNRKIILIDGQQRLSTLYLLLWYIDRTSLESTEFRYEVRRDTDSCLANLKKMDFAELSDEKLGDVRTQDVHFIKQAISQIHGLLGSGVDLRGLEEYIKTKIRAIYIPITRKDDAVSTFTMMNGSKAIMRIEELVKSELLRKVSLSCKDFSFEASSMEEVLSRLRDFSAMDWSTAEMRSRYAREWDRWLYWWNRKEVKVFFRTQNENRPLGLLLEFYHRGHNGETAYANIKFNEFRNLHLSVENHAVEIFNSLRRLQKQFEDVFNDYYTHNMLSMALSCGGDRNKIILFFMSQINSIDREKMIKQFTEGCIIGLSPIDAESLAVGNAEFEEKKEDFINSLLGQFVYGHSDENAFRYLTYRNIIESNKLKERFNIGIFFNRSLEHIHPKSKVYHIEKDTHQLMRGDNSPITGLTDYPDPMPSNVIKRSDIKIQEGNEKDSSKVLQLSEHSICNIVLLYGKDNSEFGNKPFFEKKKIFFQVTDEKKIFISRTLQHTLSKFSKQEWTIKDMIEYYRETAQYLNNEFLS